MVGPEAATNGATDTPIGFANYKRSQFCSGVTRVEFIDDNGGGRWHAPIGSDPKSGVDVLLLQVAKRALAAACDVENFEARSYRVYYIRRDEALVILLAGGDKRTQDHDIATAIKIARGL